MRLNNLKKRILRKIKFNNLRNKSKKLNLLYKILIRGKLNLFDIGAGQRILPEFMNFDGISKIHLIDPNKNINYSYNQLRKYFQDHDNIFKFQTAISDKTKTQNYYESKISTISTFSVNKKNKNKISKLYYPKPKKINLYSFKDFLKNYKLSKPDMVKIDVEGLEFKVLNSVLSCSLPLIVQIEANINNSIFSQSFDSINKLMVKKGYILYSLFPSYGDKAFRSNLNTNFININLEDIETNFKKQYLLQAECFYIKKKNIYSINDLLLFSGFGLTSFYLDELEKNKNKFNKSIKEKLQKIYNIIK